MLAGMLTIGWTVFSAVSKSIPIDRAFVLLGASVPVMLLVGLWAFLGLEAGQYLRRRD